MDRRVSDLIGYHVSVVEWNGGNGGVEWREWFYFAGLMVGAGILGEGVREEGGEVGDGERFSIRGLFGLGLDFVLF